MLKYLNLKAKLVLSSLSLKKTAPRGKYKTNQYDLVKPHTWGEILPLNLEGILYTITYNNVNYASLGNYRYIF